MGLRGLAGEMARNTSGLWRGIADALDPASPTGAGVDHIDLTRPEGTDPGTGEPTVAGPIADTEGGSPTEHGGRMVVPLDTWTRILEQIGNVHEAGQQLAEARERAARAETENRFLREQLAELKTSARPARRRTADPSRSPSNPPAAAPAPAGPPPAESRLTRARRRASTWLNP